MATRLDEGDGNAIDPDVAAAAGGRTIIAWRQHPDIVVAVHDLDGGWTEPFVVDSESSTVGGPRVGIDDRGCATVVWSKFRYPQTPDGWDVAAVRVDAGARMAGTTVVLDGGPSWAFGAHVVVHGDGAVTAAWIANADGLGGDVVSARFE